MTGLRYIKRASSTGSIPSKVFLLAILIPLKTAPMAIASTTYAIFYVKEL